MITMEPIAVNAEQAAALLGISPSALHRLRARGVLPPPRQVGGSARWLVAELRAAVEKLPVSELLPPPGGARQE